MQMLYQFIYESISKYGKYVQSKGVNLKAWREGNSGAGKFVSFLQPMPSGFQTEDTQLAGVDCFHVQASKPTKKVILYLHGGGYIFGFKHLGFIHKPFAVNLGKYSGAQVWVPDYRLLPENSLEDALSDVMNVYQALLDRGTQPSDIHVVGDSAGAGMALTMMFKLRAAQAPMPANLTLLSVWADMFATGETMKTRADVDHQFHAKTIEDLGALVSGLTEPNNRDHSPLYGDFTGLPPLLLIVGNDEILLDDSRRVFKRAKAAGVKVDIQVYKGMFHVFPLYEAIYPEGRDALQKMADFIESKPKKRKTISRIA